ncbi:hypothetical protein F4553_003785 [Allocatelliglobosispora scoriae]|uniref:DUF3800 domain-containing protein n=1 Tax=Allocatelliglobosispora scoriae TaxID=643052 RepID=A0A841BSN4_9ACTN|nr:DUF3800 domain-containing protein [Allocatelliglobosispora scoriae]MBB5870406.1 hypothetical protein [Allocatelliglobosispora scoriae]
MFLAYVDESYTKGKSWYYLAALLIPDRQAVSLTEALDEVVSVAAASYGVSGEAELHGHEVFHGKGAWSAIPREQVRVRISIFARVFRAIVDHDVSIVLRGVNGEQLQERYRHPMDPHSIVLSHTLERINHISATADEFALVISDEVPEAARHRADLSSYRAASLSQIVDTLHFAPSSSSRLLQAADMVIFMHQRMERYTTDDSRALRVNKSLWDILAPSIIDSHCWLPMTDRKHESPASAGLKAHR